MAAIYYTGGAGDGNWGTAGNWSGGAAPVSNDTVTMDHRGAGNITDGLNQSAVSLGSLDITDGFAGYIGTASAPLQIGVNGTGTQVLKCNGRGQWYKFSGTVINADVGLGTGQLFGMSGGTWGTSGKLRFGGGVIDISSSAEIVNSGVVTFNRGCEVTIGNHATDIGTLYNNGAKIVLGRDVDNYFSTSPASHCALINAVTVDTKAWIFAGTLNDRSSGTLVEVETFPGAKYTPVNSPWTAKTVTTGVIWSGSTFERNSGVTVVTVTTQVSPPGIGL